MAAAGALVERAEWLVGAVMVIVGLWTLWQVRRGHVHIHRHAHEPDTVHAHFHVHLEERGHVHPIDPGWMRRGATAYAVGSLHGFAGSGPAAALAVLVAPTAASAVIYLLSFGVGSVLGMVSVALFALWPLVHASSRAVWVRRLLLGVTGVTSVIIGLLLAGGAL
jgi:hypothetical protein